MNVELNYRRQEKMRRACAYRYKGIYPVIQNNSKDRVTVSSLRGYKRQ